MGMVFFPLAICCVVIRFIVADMNPFESIPGNINYEGTPTEAVNLMWSYGRVGICLLAFGFLLMQGAQQQRTPTSTAPDRTILHAPCVVHAQTAPSCSARGGTSRALCGSRAIGNVGISCGRPRCCL